MDRWIISNFIPWANHQCRMEANHQGFDPYLGRNEDLINLALQSFLSSLSSLIDLRRPQDRYPDARRYKRQIHLHVGPTNSGKTHSALRALHGAHTGVYAGPLRLLAHEVFTRMNKGQIAHDLAPRACNLITGEEQRTVEIGAGLVSCTVEMLSPHQYYDVVVIDEIQMIGDHYRGDAWTQAVLGTQAKELHLCGEESVKGLIEKLSKDCGDEFILHQYERLTPLKVSNQSLQGDLSQIRKGDCVVTFSRNKIYELKKLIQEKTNLRVGMAYGGLPPEVREREAQMFNSGSEIKGEGGYDVLVGSDAIGMGLNLKIKRVIFEALYKFDGQREVNLSSSQIKQIGGRAGRFGILPNQSKSEPNQSLEGEPLTQCVGEVTTLQEFEMPLLRKCMVAPFEPITQAVIKAPFETVQGLARMVPTGVRFSTLLNLRQTLTVTSPIFAIGDETNPAGIAEMLEEIKHLSLAERDLFCSAPVNSRNPVAMSALRSWATAHAKQSISSMKSLGEMVIQTLNETNEKKISSKEKVNSQTLLRLESLHKCLVLYLWLGFRLPETFTDLKRCTDLKVKSEEALSLGLNALGYHHHRLEQSLVNEPFTLESGLPRNSDHSTCHDLGHV
ncbi:P-loop containing nucleoside triphosphate hydrolase protein [Melampsora americana]|nr:P-loop containing nucleoside triphosphate hydrolase protein [Melampsora americana]